MDKRYLEQTSAHKSKPSIGEKKKRGIKFVRVKLEMAGSVDGHKN